MNTPPPVLHFYTPIINEFSDRGKPELFHTLSSIHVTYPVSTFPKRLTERKRKILSTSKPLLLARRLQKLPKNPRINCRQNYNLLLQNFRNKQTQVLFRCHRLYFVFTKKLETQFFLLSSRTHKSYGAFTNLPCSDALP